MSSVITIWATAVATVDVLARISLMLASAATAGTARRAAGQAAAEPDGTAAEAASEPVRLLAGPAGRTPAGGAAR
jgi:hypothetical protein